MSPLDFALPITILVRVSYFCCKYGLDIATLVESGAMNCAPTPHQEGYMVTRQFQQEQKELIATLPCEQKGDILHSVQRAFSVLQLIADRPQGMSARDISRHLHLNISTCYHILNTLQASGYIERHPHSQIYSLGPQIPYLN